MILAPKPESLAWAVFLASSASILRSHLEPPSFTNSACSLWVTRTPTVFPLLVNSLFGLGILVFQYLFV